MVDVASRATKGVIIPNRNATRAEIIDLFKRQMIYLHGHLNVSPCLALLHGLHIYFGVEKNGDRGGQPNI